MDSGTIKALRQRLGLTQEAFASLLGFSFVSVNKWENGASKPTDLSAALLSLLANAATKHDAATIIQSLRAAGGTPLEVIRILARLER